ncbi:unnamed protein product [Diabrotica balteata]|uniref:Uncharacterized protein n=1 Tax=Diabrotica balteata TaxID=107213 RepID=A0A9N9XA51_DIABA|nr:unnamed protein product [Diabrotica balteata]
MHKFVLAGIAVLTIQIACINKANADENDIYQECLKSNGLESDYLEKLKEEEIDNKTLCFTKCTMDKLKLIDENGKLILENNIKIIDDFKKGDDKAKKIAKNCMSLITTISTCEDTLKHNACMSPIYLASDN